MKITKIRAVGPTNVDFPVRGVDPAVKFILKGAEGLGPVEVDVLPDGRRRPRDREIVLLVGLQPAWNLGQTAEQLRTELYGLLTPRYGSMIKLQLMDGATVKAYAEGQVKKMEIGVFSRDPEVQITLGCLGATRSYFLGESQIDSTPTINFSGGESVFTVNNTGTAPAGFRFRILFSESVEAETGVEITDGQEEGQWMKVNRGFSVGDRLVIDTREGERGVWRVPNGGSDLISILNDFDEESDWMSLHAGDNQLDVNAEFTWYGTGFSHTPAFWGV